MANRPLVVVSNVLMKHVDGKVCLLLGRRTKDGLWCTPGGKVERETLEEAAVREQKEETGLDLRGGHYLITVTEDLPFKEKGQQHHVVVHFRWLNWSGELRVAEPSHDRWEWVPLEQAMRYRLKPGARSLVEYLLKESF